MHDTDSAVNARNHWNVVEFITGRTQVTYNEFISFFGEPSLSYSKDINLTVLSKILQSAFNMDTIIRGAERPDVTLQTSEERGDTS